MTVGERMKQRRKELSISAESIAERLNVSPATIYRYENGGIEKLPSHILSDIAVILNTTPAWLMGWVDNHELVTVDNPLDNEPSEKAVSGATAPQISPERAALLSFVESLPESQVGSALKALQFYRSLVEDEHK